jgi:hypothetical protein
MVLVERREVSDGVEADQVEERDDSSVHRPRGGVRELSTYLLQSLRTNDTIDSKMDSFQGAAGF